MTIDEQPEIQGSDTGPLHRLFELHPGKATDKWEQYLIAYESEFARFRELGRPVRLLEIGVQNGGSLELWHSYLPQGSSCVGLDIDERVAGLAYESPLVSAHACDATDRVAVEGVIGDQTFDIIIDDASHRCQDVIATFEVLFERLTPTGKYFIEDLHCGYYHDFGGGLRKADSSIEFFKTFVDALNFDHISLDDLPEGEGRAALSALNRWIARITFYDSLCVVEKTSHAKVHPYRRALSGVAENLVPTSTLLRLDRLGRGVLLGEPLSRLVDGRLLDEVKRLRAGLTAISALLEQTEIGQAEIASALLEAKQKAETLCARIPEFRAAIDNALRPDPV